MGKTIDWYICENYDLYLILFMCDIDRFRRHLLPL